MLNRILLRLTDEIKNPLVSIYTFLELLPQRYDDPEFRDTFFSVVGRDTQHLISLVDKLITLAGEREYEVDFCDVRDLLAERLGDGSGRAATNVQRFEGSFTRYPVLSEIAVTYRCNLACTFCYAGCGTPDASPGNADREKHRNWWKIWRRTSWWKKRHSKRDPMAQEMSTEEVLKVIDQISQVGKVPSVKIGRAHV